MKRGVGSEMHSLYLIKHTCEIAEHETCRLSGKYKHFTSMARDV